MYKHLMRDKRHSKATWDENSIDQELMVTTSEAGGSRFRGASTIKSRMNRAVLSKTKDAESRNTMETYQERENTAMTRTSAKMNYSPRVIAMRSNSIAMGGASSSPSRFSKYNAAKTY